MIEITKTPHEHKIEDIKAEWRQLFVLIQENKDAMTDTFPTLVSDREIAHSNIKYYRNRRALFPLNDGVEKINIHLEA